MGAKRSTSRKTMKVVLYVQIPDDEQVTEAYYRNHARWGNEGTLHIYDLDGKKIFSGRIALYDLSSIIGKHVRALVKPVLEKVGFLLPKGHPRRGNKSYERSREV